MIRHSIQRVGAIAWLTLKAAARFRVILALAVVLFAAVALLPFLIKHNGTARMFSQVLLTYSLYLAVGLLSLSTLWLACGLHATDMEPGQLQLLAVKPAARWQIYLGRWVGILILNTTLLAGAATTALMLLDWRATSLAPEQREILKNEILVARGSIREQQPNFDSDVEKILARRAQEGSLTGLDPDVVRRELMDQVRARHEALPPNYRRMWDLEFGPRAATLAGQPLHLRVRFHVARRTDQEALVRTVWLIGDPATGRFWRETKQLAPDIFHEWPIPPDLFSPDGKLQVVCENRDSASILFPVEDGAEVLFREGSFASNCVRALLVVLCWLSLLAALGLTSASFLSFSIATLFSLCLILVGLSGETFSQTIQDGTVMGRDEETGEAQRTAVDPLLLPLYRVARIATLPVQGFSPIETLSQGRTITWLDVTSALLHIVVLSGGLVAAVGIIAFTRRELAKEQAQA